MSPVLADSSVIIDIRQVRNRGKSTGPLPDFFIGAHAAVTGMKLITRDTSRIKTYFPSVEVIEP